MYKLGVWINRVKNCAASGRARKEVSLVFRQHSDLRCGARLVRYQKNRAISIYYNKLHRILHPRNIGCDCLHRYVPSGQIRAIP